MHKICLKYFEFLTSQTCISHDCVVGFNNVFSTVIVCGRTIIGNENTFNIRSTVIPDRKIGSGNIIQAGMIVDKNIEDKTTLFYRFKEKVLAIPQNN